MVPEGAIVLSKVDDNQANQLAIAENRASMAYDAFIALDGTYRGMLRMVAPEGAHGYDPESGMFYGKPDPANVIPGPSLVGGDEG